MYETRMNLDETRQNAVVQLLDDQLADAIDLQLQAKQAHASDRSRDRI